VTTQVSAAIVAYRNECFIHDNPIETEKAREWFTALEVRVGDVSSFALLKGICVDAVEYIWHNRVLPPSNPMHGETFYLIAHNKITLDHVTIK